MKQHTFGRLLPLALILLVTGMTPAAEIPAESLRTDPGTIAVEFSAAAVGGAICAAGLGYLFKPTLGPSGAEWQNFGGTIISGAIGYPVFCALGAWVAGRGSGQHGRLDDALVGAFATTPVAISLAWVAVMMERSPKVTIKSSPVYIIAALVPAAGAVYGYNHRIRTCPPHTEGAMSRLGLPSLTVTAARAAGVSFAPVVGVQILDLRF